MIVDVRSERLLLRIPTVGDVQVMMAIHQDTDVIRYLAPPGQPNDLPVAWKNVALMIGHWHLRGYGTWIVVRMEDGKVLGRVGLWHPEGTSQPELGWVIRRDEWGKGYGTEAASACLHWTWRHTSIPEVFSTIDPENATSLRLAQKIGQKLTKGDAPQRGDKLLFSAKRP